MDFAQAYREARENKESNPQGTQEGSESVLHFIQKMVIEVRIGGKSGFSGLPSMLLGW
jgi:hypothetical protein